MGDASEVLRSGQMLKRKANATTTINKLADGPPKPNYQDQRHLRLIMLEGCAESLRGRFPVAAALLDEKLLEGVAIFHVKRSFDLLRSAARDTIGDRLEWFMPVDSPNDRHLLAIARPLRPKRTRASIEELLDLLERSDLFAEIGRAHV